jgi:hypothetical protein
MALRGGKVDPSRRFPEVQREGELKDNGAQPAHPQHGHRLSAYQRKENDFYPTPPGVALGLTRLGLDLPPVALDPCGGDGARRRCLSPFGVDVRLSDLYTEM